MRRIVTLALFLATLVGVASVSAQEFRPWAITDFEVIQGEPFGPYDISANFARLAMAAGIDTVDAVDANPPLTPAMKADLEAFLHDAAVQLQEWRFPAPNLPPNGNVIPVYYTNFPEYDGLINRFYGRANTAAGVYDWVFHEQTFVPEINVIFLNADDIADANGLKPFGYVAAAHELFHAVQNAAPFHRNSHERNPWLIEGQADAVAFDLVRLLRPDEFRRLNDSWARVWGGRNYTDSLVVEPEGDDHSPIKGYLTASFWRYLAEVDQQRSSPRYAVPVGPDVHAVNYGYLAYFNDRTINTSNDGDGELDWLDAMTRTYPNFQRPLRDLYANFVVAYAAYGEHRVDSTFSVGGTARARREWQNLGFGVRNVNTGDFLSEEDGQGCHNAVLSNDVRHARVMFYIKRASALCIALGVDDFTGEVGVNVDLAAQDSARLQQLRIGVAGEPRTATTEFVGERGEDARTRHVFRVQGDETTRFVITSMAATPSETVDQVAVVHFSITGNQVAGVTPPGGAAAPSPAPGDPDFVGPTLSPKELARRRMADAAGRVTSNGRLAAGVSRRERSREMAVRLSLVPDAGNVLGEVSASGSSAAQAIGRDAANQELQSRMAEFIGATDAIAGTDGASIQLRFPLVDYGFTGRFTNAEITFSRPQERDLHAVDRDRNPTGEVVIEEYSPAFMTGTFSGALVNPDEVRRGAFEIVHNVTGRFWIGAPWFGDERVEIKPSDTLAEDILNDLVAQAPGMMAPEFAGALGAPVPEAPGDPGAPGGPAAPPPQAGVLTAACDCSCAAYARFEELSARADRPGFSPTPEDNALMACTLQCMGSFAACAR